MRRGLLLSAVLAIALSSVAVAPVVHAAFPGQNGRIAYVTTAGDHRAIYTVDARGADPSPLIDLGSGRDAINPAWSWDGQSIAFAGQTSPGGPFAIYVADASGSAPPRQMTTPPVSDTDPTWEPYGTQIAFTRRLDADASVIAIVTLSTEAVTTLPVPGISMEPSWSPDGRSIAFANKAPTASCHRTPCRFEILETTPDGQTVRGIAWEYFYDLHHPDWSPDGSLIVARLFAEEDPPYGPQFVYLYDPATGEALHQVGPCHLVSEPSFSPDGQWVVLTATPVNNDTGELGEPFLCAVRTDNTDHFFSEGSSPSSDAAWGIVPGSAPPPPDRTPPTIEFRPDPSTSDWLDAGLAGSVHIVATDDRSPPSVACTDNGEPLSLTTESSGSTTDAVATLAEGSHRIDCTATDGAGYSTAGSANYQVDLTPPTTFASLSPIPTVVRVGETVSLSAYADDFGSGIRSLDVRVEGLGALPPIEWENAGYAARLTASYVPTKPDLSKVIVSARDNAGWVGESSVPFVSYDPSAGSTDGTGWIVPGGPTSEPGDFLPGLDGVRKASFGFTAKYKTPSSVAPSGTLTFSYGNRFKLQSRQLLWLAVRDEGTAYLGGFASIQGMYGEFPFVAVNIDGTSTASADRFELQVYEPGTEIASPTPLFAASGEVGGQIQIRS